MRPVAETCNPAIVSYHHSIISHRTVVGASLANLSIPLTCIALWLIFNCIRRWKDGDEMTLLVSKYCSLNWEEDCEIVIIRNSIETRVSENEQLNNEDRCDWYSSFAE